MVNIAEVAELIKLVDQSSIDEIELRDENICILLKKGAQGEQTVALQPLPATAILETASDQAAVSNGAIDEVEDLREVALTPPMDLPIIEIASNWVGVFRSSVKLGDQIKKGQVVCRCHVESLTLTHDIHSNVNGEIIDILVEDGQFIDYGQPLFIVHDQDPRRKNDV
ncbi:hypothetical protein BEP19_04610 [Ammoniphilus oxalaticus]|uniref:Lipoyl-binding domain-containing protein n=1 Tax=Ammoniphilus oxalaticus TaxID=66863 RepID=A0A419SM64_9BACL|nr:biotin/lipoyl-containing protein [Ammoniphilus oxalaticus]RKD25105.1 hypothetical protein BEP19_04610 [Ammoniphilus oxalaticus]